MKYATKKEIGDYGERLAARYLFFHGYRILARNYRTGPKELDIIAVRGSVISFVEVKTRSYYKEELALAPPPGVAVNAEKQHHTRRAAMEYLHIHPTRRKPRMDVVEVCLEKRTDGKRPRLLKLRHMTGAY